MKKLILLTLLLAGCAFGQVSNYENGSTENMGIAFGPYPYLTTGTFYSDYIYDMGDVDSIRYVIGINDTVIYKVYFEKFLVPGVSYAFSTALGSNDSVGVYTTTGTGVVNGTMDYFTANVTRGTTVEWTQLWAGRFQIVTSNVGTTDPYGKMWFRATIYRNRVAR